MGTMKSLFALRALVAAFALVMLPLQSFAQVPSSLGSIINAIVGIAPPALPYYEQPVVPAPNDLWMPGSWAWGPGGYYWVPGTWVAAPQPGLVWTPGYWARNGNGYSWNQGYWANNVGYYGGVNYGGGYDGNGYDGGRWSGNVFRYNTYVTHVDSRIHNVYIDRTVYVNRSPSRVSYVGGPNGLRTHPTAAQLVIAHERHFGLTPTQREHVQVAAQDRNLRASVNHGRPNAVAVSRPYTAPRRPVGLAPAEHHVAPVQHAAVPADHHVAPAQHAAVPADHNAAPAKGPAKPEDSHPDHKS